MNNTLTNTKTKTATSQLSSFIILLALSSIMMVHLSVFDLFLFLTIRVNFAVLTVEVSLQLEAIHVLKGIALGKTTILMNII